MASLPSILEGSRPQRLGYARAGDVLQPKPFVVAGFCLPGAPDRA